MLIVILFIVPMDEKTIKAIDIQKTQNASYIDKEFSLKFESDGEQGRGLGLMNLLSNYLSDYSASTPSIPKPLTGKGSSFYSYIQTDEKTG